MPCTAASAFSRAMWPSSSASVVSAGSRVKNERMPISSHALTLLRTYTADAGILADEDDREAGRMARRR